MTDRSRMWRLGVAGALAALMAAVSLGPILHAAAGHDADCDPVLIVHDAAQHRFAAIPSDGELPADEHCVLCHLFRSSRGVASTEPAGPRGFDPEAMPRAADDGLVTASATLPLPARAPPVCG